MKRWRIAMVVQRYGLEVSGGAELHARWLAEHLTQIAHVELFTTCALDYQTWENHYPAGTTTVNDIPVHRFPVDAPRDWASFQRFTRHFYLNERTIWDELNWLKQQGPYSTALLKAIEEAEPRFDAFIFVTYVYATTYFGLSLVPHKAILIPTAHEEPFLELPIYRNLFNVPQAIVYNTSTEQRFVQRQMQNTAVPSIVAGVGINVPSTFDAQRVRDKFNLHDPYVAYVGRIAESKNIPELLRLFIQFKAQHKQPLKLLLMGRSLIPLPDHPDIVPVGHVSEQDKFDALHGAVATAIPSKYESLSMLAMESWLAGTPVLVNGNCSVLRDQCVNSNGGLYYTNDAEFNHTLTHLANNPVARQKLGQQGKQFTSKHYNWDTIVAKYQALLETLF